MLSLARIAVLCLGLALVEPAAAAHWWDWLWPFGGSHKSDATDSGKVSPAAARANASSSFDPPGRSETIPVTGTVVNVKLESELQIQATLLQEGLKKERPQRTGHAHGAFGAHERLGELRGTRPKGHLPADELHLPADELPAPEVQASGPAAAPVRRLQP